MARIGRDRKGQLLRRLFEILSPHPTGLNATEALSALRTGSTLTDYELEQLPSGASRYETIIYPAVARMKIAGWLGQQKRTWMLTDVGRTAYNSIKLPSDFYEETLKLSGRSEVAEEELSPAAEEVQEETSSAEVTFEQAEQQSWAAIEAYLRGMSPYDFQDLVAALLKGMGYHIAHVAPPGKDGGIDLIAFTDPLGTRPPRIKVQVKRYSSNVTTDMLRSFMAVLSQDDLGLFVTTSSFTKDARDEARNQQTRKVTLIDLERFFDLWVEHYPKLDDAARRRFPLQPIYFLAPAN